MITLNPNIKKNAKLCYMDTDSFITHIKIEYVYKDTVDDIKKRYDTSIYEVYRPSPKGMTQKVIDLMKDELGGNIIMEFAALRPKTYS